MRPTAPGGNESLVSRPRKSSFADQQQSLTPGNGIPTTFFLADERRVEEAAGSGSGEYGVRSLEEVVSEDTTLTTEDAEKAENDDREDRCKQIQRLEGGDSPVKGSVTPTQPSNPLQTVQLSQPPSADRQPSRRRPSQTTFSQPLTPLFIASPAPGSSLPSSPKSASIRSLRHSDEDSLADDGGSQAVVSSGEEDSGALQQMRDSAPQLVMPSIKMPSRRPFTERGKAMGRLKVLITGDSGIGKTSLIKSIVQMCEDIVHVDPLSPSPASSIQSSLPRKKPPKVSRRDAANPNSTKQITEVYASTKPYPSWWSDLEESRILRRRRKSMGDVVLERNLCFVDTPGYGNGTSFLEYVDPVVQYVESQLERTASAMRSGEGDVLGLLSGNGASQVDVVFYMILHRVKPVDLEYMKRLSPLTNVIPIIAKADTLDAAEIKLLKASIASELQSADIRPFLFGMTCDDLRWATEPCAPFAVSSAVASDAENMDASLLMSPDYVQPLISTELSALVDRVFQRDSIAWLRHAAAKKFMHWRSGSASSSMMTQSPHSPLSMQSSTYAQDTGSSPSSFFGSSSSPPSHIIVPPMGATSSYALARVTDHTHHEEHVAQVRLAKWASDLQRSLQNERERYEALARGERAVWLTERLGECVADGTLVPISGNNVLLARQGNNNSRYMSAATPSGTNPTARKGLNPRDPLGLLGWNEKIKTRGWLVIRVLGGCGVVGGMAVWIAKSWGYDGLVNWYWGWWGGVD
ncbi:hypothetical protein FGG08_005793 [Glutinoglossum americanum]|uniref:Septin-type G domain-containing protein n=1 Tax=Glutinoglossum americanum TaxID=1670608 RepID=A0A9P8KVN8_9PEZI|nr:hypothetical protein FGG08_005793 [Glutinoglossum americanum]